MSKSRGDGQESFCLPGLQLVLLVHSEHQRVTEWSRPGLGTRGILRSSVSPANSAEPRVACLDSVTITGCLLKCRFPDPAPKASCSGALEWGPEICILIRYIRRFFFFLFLNFWLCWIFIAEGAFLSLWCMSFSLQWVHLLGSTGSRACGLQ